MIDLLTETIVKPKSKVQSLKVKTKRTWDDTKITRAAIILVIIGKAPVPELALRDLVLRPDNILF